MDCLFNSQIPKSSPEAIIIRPSKRTFASGLAYSYNAKYPHQLKDMITEEDYCDIIFSINDNIKYY